MPYIVSPSGVVVDSTVGTFPAFQTITGGTVTVDTVDSKMLHVDNWPFDEHATQDIIDENAGYIFLADNGLVAKITGLQFNGDGFNMNTHKLDINIDIPATGGSADFNYITIKDASQNWDVKIENQGNANITINGQFPIVAGHNSVFSKARYIRPVAIDATDSVAVATNAVI